ncbi:MAG: RagB/SusD family nutrient uptake outer membrane protein [Phocaeicola sp.]|uniref:RagB/SusD family nutrient uptake outer membrane protein n=1 Tax=Phocaeicola sp. TaxID=2773926 RepID=UPI003FA0CD5A
MKKILYLATATVLAFTSCNLDENPKAQIGKGPIFGSENGLSMYANSFYGVFTNPANSLTTWGDVTNTFYEGTNSYRRFYTNDYLPSNEGSWYWGTLRNINYFLDNNTDTKVDEKVRNNYNGIARFFRAYFYFDKVCTYCDVPWIDHALDVDDELLKATRDPHAVIADHIYEDFEYAINNITAESDATATRVTKMVAAAMQSRFCLWEGTFRKYHTEAGLTATADTWLQRAQQAAEIVIKSGDYSIYTAEGDQSYRALFKAKDPINQEVMLATVFNSAEGLTNAETRRVNTTTLGGPFAPIRQYMNLYLKLDGTPYTADGSYKTTPFTEEWNNRDTRAKQSVRTPGFTRINGSTVIRTAPDYACAKCGYQGYKFALDDETFDGVDAGENNKIELRYAEVLLNWAEAKAELGTMTDADWASSIGVLRARGGITGGLSTKPTTIDSYLQETFFPSISDPTILEVRRERLLELTFEDFTFADIQRWKCGYLMEMPMEGVYVPKFDTLIDMDLDGNPDVYFWTGTEAPSPKIAGVYYRQVQLTPDADGNYTCDTTVEADGHTLLFNANGQKIVWNDRMYFHPISQTDIILNPNLTQNPGY